MIRLALTGSIGMGKSTVAGMFARAGIPVFDADAVVRRLQGPGGALVAKIEERFPGTTGKQGVDRDALSQRVLGDPGELAALEAIVHPAVHHERTRFIVENGDAKALLFEIPLLFETGGEEAFDKVIVVTAPGEVQQDRVMTRAGMTEDKFQALLARQTPDEEKRRRADFVIDTGGDLSTTESQVRDILSCLGLGPGG
ncbi:MAG TPA: dephospho-CoA kinase [Sphingomicrobium sp.]|nr:dephospho-CoA kinase [Sphingomicrobium sp.]